MAQITCPVLFVLGEQDQMTPPKAAKGLIEAAKAAGKRCKVQMIPNGHNQMTESPDATLFAMVFSTVASRIQPHPKALPCRAWVQKGMVLVALPPRTTSRPASISLAIPAAPGGHHG